MEMAMQTKENKRATATATSTAAAKRAQATGNGNSYTQRISAVKEQEVEKNNCYPESRAKAAEIQYNKEEIKISHYKSKSNQHLNIFIKFYLLIKQIIEILKTVTNPNYSCKNSPNCIINLRQEQQQTLHKKAVYFKTNSFFIFKIVIEFLTNFHYHYFSRKILNNSTYVNLIQIYNTTKHFIGICLKRLISLKRLQQQIPENHAKIEDESSLKITQIKIRYCHYGYLKEKRQFNKARSLMYSMNCLIEAEELNANWNILKCNIKYFARPQCHTNCQTIKAHKSCALERSYSCRQFSLSKAGLIEEKFSKKLCQLRNTPQSRVSLKINQQLNSCKVLLQIKVAYKTYSRDYKYGQLFCICARQRYQFNFIYIFANGRSGKVAKVRHFQINVLLKESQFKLQLSLSIKHLVLLEHDCGNQIVIKSKRSQANFYKAYGLSAEFKKSVMQQLFTCIIAHQCGQQCTHRVAMQYSNSKGKRIKLILNPEYQESVENLKEKCNHFVKCNAVQSLLVLIDFPQECSQLKKYDFEKSKRIPDELRITGNLQKNSKNVNKQITELKDLKDNEIQEFAKKSLEQSSGHLNQNVVLIENFINKEYQTKTRTAQNSENALRSLKKIFAQFINNQPDNLTTNHKEYILLFKINKTNLSCNQEGFNIFKYFLKTSTSSFGIEKEEKKEEEGNVKIEEETKLAGHTRIVRQFQLDYNDNNNNSCQVESKEQIFLKTCQHIPYSSLVYCFCCCCCWFCCYWHIYGFPLVLERILKYLEDATVHVLTRRFKITTITIIKVTVKTILTTSICYSNNDGNIKAACDGGKLKKSTKISHNKANEQSVSKRQTTHTITATTTIFARAYSSFSFSCLTTSLTSSSSYCKSLENLIQLQKQIRQPWMSYCHYQQYQHQHQRHHHRHHHHHHHHHRRHHYYKHHHPQILLQQRQQPLQKQQHHQQHQHQHQHQYNSSSAIHLQLPSLLVVSRTLIILILLSSLWHTSEGFHGSGVKLSANTVKTKYGLVRGIVVRSSPSLVEAYLGIPYASPPVGSLRFMPPITPSTWKNIRNADRFSPVCPQNVPIPPNGPEALLEVPRARLAQLRRLLPLLSNQSEDCLYLNIYVPYENRRHRRFTTNSGELNDTTKLPTILFIHGESYEWNSGNPYDGTELAAHGNVIVVTINFRLGILGFLKTGGKESAQGNFGLMDLVAGLHWLKENLPAFGGDPQQITLLGHGTGAALANILVVSPVASDLVQHIAMVSGSALSPWAIQKNPLFVKRRVAEQTGCHGDMLYYDLAPCLRTKTLAELLAVKIDHPRFLVGFAPFVDGTVISPNTNSVGKLSLPLGSAIVSTSGIEYANFPKRNLIFCLTSVESHLDLNAQDLEFGFNETRRDRILRTYVRNNFHYHLNEIFAVLKNEYTDWDKAIRSPLSSRDATLQFLSDGHTASSLVKLGYMHSLRGGRGYFLHFKHRTVEEEYPQRTGSVRGEDVPFWLGLPISPLFPHNYTTQEKQISRLMLRYLANFAKTGNPNLSSLSSPLPSSSSLIGAPSSPSTTSSQAADDDSHEKIKKISSSNNIVNATSLISSGPIRSSNIIEEDVVTAAAREALNLAVLYNQRRTKRTYYKRHSRSNDDHSGSASDEVNYFLSTNNDNNNNNKLDSVELPFWDAYDVVNQLYIELGNKAEIQSHYRGHKLSMWLNLIPQLHRHANMNDQSMRHHQFQDDLNNLNLYEGIVRAQIQTKPDDDEDNFLLPKFRPTPPPTVPEINTTQKAPGGTTECGVDGAMFVAELTTLPPTDNHSLVLDSREKEMATASTGIIGNLEVLRRLSGKQFQSYTTALVATVAVGCFLLILNILIFAGIYHQREKRARDAKTKEELQDNDASKNSSMLKLNAMGGSETGSFNDSAAGVSGKTSVVFGEYSCYDEKSLQTKDEKLIVELPTTQMADANWASCSTSTLDLLKTKHHAPLDTTYTLRNVVPISTEPQTEHLLAINNLEMATYSPLPMASGLVVDPAFVPTSSTGLLSKRGSFVGSSGQLNQYDFASVQSSDQMSFKDIENAVKASAALNDDITQDDDIPEPPPPPRSFQSLQQQQQQQIQTAANVSASSASGSGGGGILRQSGTTSATQTSGSKKRVHIQEISV